MCASCGEVRNVVMEKTYQVRRFSSVRCSPDRLSQNPPVAMRKSILNVCAKGTTLRLHRISEVSKAAHASTLYFAASMFKQASHRVGQGIDGEGPG